MAPIALALISNSIIATALYLIAEIAWRCRQPALAHSILVLALLKLVTPPIWHVSWPALSDPPAFASKSSALQAISIPRPLAWGGDSRPTTSQPLRIDRQERHDASAIIETHWIATARILPCIWLGGSLALLVVAALRTRQFCRIARDATMAGPELAAEIQAIAVRLAVSRSVEARVFHADAPPMIWFMGRRPLLFLPENLLVQDKDKRAAVIAHELAHLHRGDHWIRVLEMLTLSALWWHPLPWLAQRRLREAEEEVCDAWVVWAMPESRKSYASILVEMVRVISQRLPVEQAAWVDSEFYKGDWS